MIVDYTLLVFLVILLWGLTLFFKNSKIKYALTILGTFLILAFIIKLWIILGRPPLKSLGETRLWYSFFLPLLGMIVDYRLMRRWASDYTIAMSSMFLLVNYFNPESFNQELVPALQSPCFIPHVIVYLLSYAILGLVTLLSFKTVLIKEDAIVERELVTIDSLVRVGLSFLTFGLLFGAIWAKEAWGHYWSWDPKETWAFITWAIYLGYVHYRLSALRNPRKSQIYLIISFLVLMLAWFGVNYMPAAKSSVHTYSVPNTN